jgi:hypothetical protein
MDTKTFSVPTSLLESGPIRFRHLENLIKMRESTILFFEKPFLH